MVARAVTERGRAWARVQAFLGGRVLGVVALGALPLGVLAGCVVELPEDRQHPCEDVRCSTDGYCRDGACYCDSGYLGNPYALRGCQSARPGASCTTTCGLNAYCDDAACVCEQGFLAVCGTGDCLALRQLCDGVPDCANMADEAAETCARQAVQQWTLLDDCDDGIDVEWRLWSRDRDWAWPGPDEAFVTDEVGVPSHEEVECLMGEVICFGAVAGELEWGVGVDGTATCDGCCFVCSDEPIDLGGLACE
jgi:hypothetical protein